MVAVVASAALLATGCSIGGKNIVITTGLSDSDLFKIDGSAFSVSEAMMYLTTEKNVYEESFGDDIWDKVIGDVTFENYVKDSVKDRCAQIKTLNLLAKERGIRLSDDETGKAAGAATKYYDALTEKEKECIGTDREGVQEAYCEYLLANKVYEELIKDINPEISDAEAKVIKVASIYAKTYTIDAEGTRLEYTDEEKQNTKNEIDNLLQQLQQGGDFMAIAAEHTDADEVEYQFGKGEMLQEFEDAAFKLKIDEISGVIETKDGYFIIKCISDYMADETQKNKEAMVQEAKNEAFREIYDPFVAELSSEFNDKAWAKIKITELRDVNVSNFYQCIDE